MNPLDGDRARNYERGANLTNAIVLRWLAGHLTDLPRFRFPHKEIAILADLRDVGERLAQNDSARRLVRELIDQVVFATGQAPTAMMLRVILQERGLERLIEWVSPSELGFQVPRA